jgi:glycosyltransferase involved in cell wall biosynthesis
MKLLYVTKELPFGAAETFIYAELDEHLAHGCEVLIAPVQNGPLIHDSGRRYVLRTLVHGLMDGPIIRGFLAEALRHPLKIAGILFATLDPRKPRLIPRNLAVWAKGVWLGREARCRGIDHIHVHWIAVPATMAMIASKVSGISMSITAHRYDIAQGNLVPEKFEHSAFVRAIDGPGAYELVEQLRPGQRPPVIIRMGVHLPARPGPLRPGPLTRLTAIIGARLVEKKGHATLFEAIAAARDLGVEVAIDVFGDGPLEQALRGRVRKLEIDDLVMFRGIASHGELLGRLQSGDYDVGVLPSVVARDGDKEGIPVFLMEAMGAGLPVISTPNGGILELIDETSGVLVPEYDVKALAEAFVRLAQEGEFRHQLAECGRRKVLSEFSIESCAEQLRERFAVAGLEY